MTRARREVTTTTTAVQSAHMADEAAVRRVFDQHWPDGSTLDRTGSVAMVAAIMAAIGRPVEPAALVAHWNRTHDGRPVHLSDVLSKLEAHGHA
jgi:hypothetical protein